MQLFPLPTNGGESARTQIFILSHQREKLIPPFALAVSLALPHSVAELEFQPHS